MDNLKCFCNRELSWLKFNERVLDLAGAEKTPIGERLNFLSIYQSNLDEFFMVRVGTLVDQMQIPDFRENKTHMSAKEQLEEVFKRYKEIEKKKNRIYSNLLHELEAFGIHLVDYTSATAAMKKELVKLFDNSIAPYLSPIITGKPMPFPFMVNKQQYVVTRLSTKGGKPKIGVINCANDEFPRLIAVPGRKSEFVLSEQVILNNVDRVFKQFKVEEKAIIRVTRNADIDADEIYDESMDYRDIMETLIKQRKRLSPVRLEVSEKLSKPFRKELCGYLGMDKDHIVLVSSDMDLTYVSKMKALLPDDKSLYYAKRIPRGSLGLNMKGSIINQVIKKDRLLSFPYESIRPFLAMLHEAAFDPNVISIKMTLYRLASRSKVIDALVDAAENGKQVTVLIELRARFDEENNIEYSRKLEEAGCHVIYGPTGYKAHAKLCLITRRNTGSGAGSDKSAISYITQVGTGNYNEKTSKLYTDLSLMTGNREIGLAAEQVFDALTARKLVKDIDYLLVAPYCLQNRIVAFIDEEIEKAREGKPAYIGAKLNSLTDKVIIDKLIEASQAGVKIQLIIRGICCIVPGIEGYTENISVVSLVGKFLEHSRIYRFGIEPSDKLFIGSADFMTRNTERRVEVAVPIFDTRVKDRIRYIFDTVYSDNVNGRDLNSNGDYEYRDASVKEINSQELLFAEHMHSSKASDRKKAMEAARLAATSGKPAVPKESEGKAQEAGASVEKKSTAKKSTAKKSTAKKSTAKKSAAKKSAENKVVKKNAAKNGTAKKSTSKKIADNKAAKVKTDKKTKALRQTETKITESLKAKSTKKKKSEN